MRGTEACKSEVQRVQTFRAHETIQSSSGNKRVRKRDQSVHHSHLSRRPHRTGGARARQGMGGIRGNAFGDEGGEVFGRLGHWRRSARDVVDVYGVAVDFVGQRRIELVQDDG